MPKSILLKENSNVNSRLKGRRSHRNVRAKGTTWMATRDLSASSYFVKAYTAVEWHTNIDVRVQSPFVKYERQWFKSLQIGEQSHNIHIELNHIAEQIEEAREILYYETDWDGDGSIATNETVFNNAATFVTNYSNFIYQNYLSTVLPAPYIDITRNGSISVFWENDKAKFLIIFKNNDSKVAYFFAERLDSKIPFKSAIEIGAPVDEAIASWMKTNLG